MSNGNSLARIRTLAEELKSPAAQERLRDAMLDTVSPERMVGVALTAASRNPKLAQCSTQSIALALMQAGSYGIEPNGRDGHLVPYQNRKTGTVDCQFIPDYKGLVKLAMLNPRVRSIAAECVFENDEFDCSYGSNAHLDHTPCWSDRGKFIAVWAMCKLANGAEAFRVLSAKEVAKHRAKAQSDNVWRDWFEEMACKTAVKALAKYLPLGGAFEGAVSHDNALEVDSEVIDAVQPGGRRAARRRPARLPSATGEALQLPDPDNQAMDIDHRTPMADPNLDKADGGPTPVSPEQLAEIDAVRRRLQMHGKTLNALCRKLVSVERPDDLSESGALVVLAKLRAQEAAADAAPADDSAEPVPTGRRLDFTPQQAAEVQQIVDRGNLSFDEYQPFKRQADAAYAADESMTVERALHDLKLRLLAEVDGRPMRDDQRTAIDGLLRRMGDAREQYEQKAVSDYEGAHWSKLTVAQADHFLAALKAAAKAGAK